MNTISVESLLRNPERLFLPSPCRLVSHATGFERDFDRDTPDAEKVLRKVFTVHFGPYSPQVGDWVTWGMDASLPRHSDTRTAKADADKFCDWGPNFDGA